MQASLVWMDSNRVSICSISRLILYRRVLLLLLVQLGVIKAIVGEVFYCCSRYSSSALSAVTQNVPIGSSVADAI